MNVITEIKLKSKLDKLELAKALESRGVKVNTDLLFDNYLSNALENHMYLTYLPDLVESPTDSLNRFYSRYYWLSNFIEKYKKKFGQDAGLEQQLFKLMEEAEHENLIVDWNLVERVQNEAVTAANS